MNAPRIDVWTISSETALVRRSRWDAWVVTGMTAAGHGIAESIHPLPM